jgi:hypothetical protein
MLLQDIPALLLGIFHFQEWLQILSISSQDQYCHTNSVVYHELCKLLPVDQNDLLLNPGDVIQCIR